MDDTMVMDGGRSSRCCL